MRINAEQFIAALKFVYHAAGKSDIRYYLNGVRVEMDGKELRLIATDGHRMAWCYMHGNTTELDAKQFTLSRDTVDTLLKCKAKGDVTEIILTPETAELCGMSVTMQLVNGNYPDWRRLLPDMKRVTGRNMMGVNMVYIQQAMSAGNHIGNKKDKGCMLESDNSAGMPELRITVPVRHEYDTIKKAGVKIMGMRT